MNIMVIATRDLAGRQTGRKAVLRTIVRTLVSLGHQVELVVIARTAPAFADATGSVRIHHVRPPRPARVVATVASEALRRRMSLNESLYVSPRLSADVAALARHLRCEIVVADMVRTAELAFATRLPVVLDLDDLLSQRYHELAATGGDPATVLGYHGENLPRSVARAGGWLAARALRWESRTLVDREVACGRRAAAVSLVSSVEADRFERVVGRAVACLPMAVDGPAAAASVAENPPTMLFTGGLDYEPNLQALRWYRDEVAPHLEATGVRLDVIGHCPERARAEVESDAIRCVGYVEDLWGSLAAGRAFLAPIVSGTGVKTKVLEAMAAGLPVVATPAAVEGIAVEHGRSCFVARTGREFADLVRLVAAEPEAAARVGRAGRDVVRATYTSAVLRRRWEAVLSGVAIEERPRA